VHHFGKNIPESRIADLAAPTQVLGQALAQLVGRDEAVARRDWLALHGDARADPPGPVALADAEVIIGDAPYRVTVLSWRHYQATQVIGAGDATTGDGAATVTLASRHLPLNRLQLAPVDSIEPYLVGYTTFLRRLAERG